jgi:molybdopterin-guanine dinucleotide biosynthesis protein A
MNPKISAAILAGGSGSRLGGRMKPKIIIEGVPIILRIIAVLKEIFDEIIIVTNNPEEFEDFSFCKIVQDEIPGAGPLGGIHAAMKNSTYDALFVFAGDMPFPDKGIILKMTDDYNNSECDALIPAVEEYIEPLHSIYRISLAGHLEAFLKTGISNAVRDYIKTLNVRYIKFARSENTEKAFTNINSPSDID